jgi:hypothetical protein
MNHSLRLPNTAGLDTAGIDTAGFAGTDSLGVSREATRRETLNQNSLPYLAAAFLVLLAWVCFEWTFPIPIFPIDDAYIVIHNARTLLSGSDPNYAGTPALAGTTSIVHLALVTGLMLFLKPLAALSASLWIAILLYALGLVRLARVNGASRVTSVLIAVLGVIAGQTPNQLVNGLETGLMLAAVTWTLTLLPRTERQPSRLLPIFCGTLPFIRPDLLPLAFLFLGVQAAHHWQMRRDLPDFLRRVGGDLSVACLFALPWALWCWAEDGSALPSTINAKRFFFAEAHRPAAIKASILLHGLAQFCVDLGLLSVFALLLVTTRLGRAGIVFGGILLLAYYAQFPSALLQYGGRYLFPFLPFLMLGTVYALHQPRKLLRLGAAFIFALSLGQSVINAPVFWARNMDGCRFTVAELDGVADWCSHHLPAKSTLLVHDAGYISCKTHFRLIDLVGLKTPSSIPYHETLTYPSAGKNRYLAVSQIALRGHPDYLVALDGWDQAFTIVAGLRAAGWDVRLVNADYSYKVYALRPPSSSALITSN